MKKRDSSRKSPKSNRLFLSAKRKKNWGQNFYRYRKRKNEKKVKSEDVVDNKCTGGTSSSENYTNEQPNFTKSCADKTHIKLQCGPGESVFNESFVNCEDTNYEFLNNDSTKSEGYEAPTRKIDIGATAEEIKSNDGDGCWPANDVEDPSTLEVYNSESKDITVSCKEEASDSDISSQDATTSPPAPIEQLFLVQEHLSSSALQHDSENPTRLHQVPLWHKCDLCEYKSNRKRNLITHMLNHMNDSTTKWYKCNSCNYKTTSESYLTGHMSRHRDPLKVTWHKCNACSFKTKRQSILKSHMLLHKYILEEKFHECDICGYKFRREGELKRHMLQHKDSSEVWNECYLREYKSKRKAP
ncbi:hypothetical protein NQ315_015548 [Exocentrus adspersus]|uniref:C2H2-type domain-containing protein n=1 Tax=Exocentrus adspersus TaxID=1586481 RepID=A0AAV8V5X4_9CUCU|nr:hypothetical protein NQ315_015548 [Exocentrus adspersus]